MALSSYTPNLLTGFLLMGVGALYSQTQATPDRWAEVSAVAMRLATPQAMRADVRISLAERPIALSGLGDAQDVAQRGVMGLAPYKRRSGGEWPRPGNGGGSAPPLTLSMAFAYPGPLAARSRDGFATSVAVAADPTPLLPDVRIGAWVARADPSALDLGRPVHGAVLPGDYVPTVQARGVIQIALDF